jgi:phage tail protein X
MDPVAQLPGEQPTAPGYGTIPATSETVCIQVVLGQALALYRSVSAYTTVGASQNVLGANPALAAEDARLRTAILAARTCAEARATFAATTRFVAAVLEAAHPTPLWKKIVGGVAGLAIGAALGWAVRRIMR